MTTIQLRRGTAAAWTTTNPILLSGEKGLETDTGLEKVGDGTSHWTSLAYQFPGFQAITEVDRLASSIVPAEGKLLVTDEALGYIGDGVTEAKNLSHLLRAAEVGLPVVDGSGDVSIDVSQSRYWQRTDGSVYGPQATPMSGSDVSVLVMCDQTGTIFAVVPGADSVSVLDRVETLEAAQPTSPVLSVLAGAWAATTAVPAATLYRLPTGGLGYCATARTTRATFDATEKSLWTFLPGGHYESFAANGSWVVPTGISHALAALTAGGGGGGGGGSASSAITQVGGGGGGAGQKSRHEITGLSSGASCTFVVGAAGTAGGGGASSGNPGTAGGTGGSSTFTAPDATVYWANGGGPGQPGLANSTTSVAAGGYALGVTTTTAFIPGFGGTASSAAGNAASPASDTVGGGGGGPSSTTLGGLGGDARTIPGHSVGQTNTKNGTTAGTAGTTATRPGCGGGGGGGGANGGAGGAGGAAAAGLIELWY